MTGVRAVRPAGGPSDAVITVPGSKSLTIRALFAAGLAEGVSYLDRPLDADDTRYARASLRSLGVATQTKGRAWEVTGVGHRLSVPQSPLDAGPSGLTARLLVAVAGLVPGTVGIVGRDRLPERPMADLIGALRTLGVVVESANDRIPLTVHGRGKVVGRDINVDLTMSTQFATALAMAAPLFDDGLVLHLTGGGASGYLDLTAQVMKAFGVTVQMSARTIRVPGGGYHPATYHIEPDASSAVYPMVAAALTGGRIVVPGLGSRSLQPDMRITAVLAEMGAEVQMSPAETAVVGTGRLDPIDVDLSDAPDGAMAIAVACSLASGRSRLRGLGTLRRKESDRLTALAEGLTRLGSTVVVEGDDLTIDPGTFTGGVVDSHGDHRIAMSFAVLGLAEPGVKIADPGVVSKTWPGFWEMLEALAE